METPKSIQVILNQLMTAPSLTAAHQLEQELAELGYLKKVFGGRINQKASIEAASEGDRGAVELLANAFDAYGIRRWNATPNQVNTGLAVEAP